MRHLQNYLECLLLATRHTVYCVSDYSNNYILTAGLRP